MHDVGVVFAGKDKAGPAHIGGELIGLVKFPIDHLTAKVGVAQIADGKVVGLALGIFMKFQIDAAHPEPIPLQPLDQMPADKAAGAADQCRFHRLSSFNSDE